jgi:uncharacterized membrane protein (DUF4010 family)
MPGAASLFVAGLVGLAVGIEREWSGHASGPDARFAGARTFLLLGLLGGVAGGLIPGPYAPLGVVLLSGGVALSVAAYAVAARRAPAGEEAREAVDGTTETAALVVLALGTLAGVGYDALASGAAAVVVLALGEKARVHRVVRAIGEGEMRAALHFAVLALVVLPILPDESYGPLGGVRPRSLWVIVLLFSALTFAGYLARRAVGPDRGYGVTGVLGGLVSSTAVTFHFSRQSRREPRVAPSLGLGVVGACTVLLPRVAVVSAVLNPAVTLALVPYLAPPLVVGGAVVAYAVTRSAPAASTASRAESRSPLGLVSSIQMAVAFQLVLWAVAFVRQTWGSEAVLASAALLGLTDTDALTLSMSRLGASEAAVALGARAIAVGVLANTVVKLVVTLALGEPRFRRVASVGLLALAAACGFGLWLGARVQLGF